ncbi:hypothetical protein [Methanomethylovorans hollandica]|nr:hypothetical protein [Methanomethylovorans hollandica]
MNLYDLLDDYFVDSEGAVRTLITTRHFQKSTGNRYLPMED